MKFFNRSESFRKNIKSLSFIFLSIFLLSSCDNEKKESEFDGNLQISLNGIEEYIEVSDNNKKLSSNNPNSSSPIEIESYADFDAITSISTSVPVETAKLTKEASIPSSIKKIATTQQLANDIKYRLIFFKTSDNSIVYNQEITANSPPRIRLELGEYKWVAYSINETSVPVFDEQTNQINKTNITNKDFLYASNTVTIAPGDNNLGIVFKRYTTKYEVKINTRGMFAKLHPETRIILKNTNGNLYRTSDFNVFSGAFEGTPVTYEINAAALQAIKDNEDDIKKVTFYTITETEFTGQNGLMLQFTPLKITLDDGVTLRNFANVTVALKHNAQAAPTTRGRKYEIDAKLVESAITVGTSATAWARSNLWYSESTPYTGKYRFRITPFQRDIVNKVNNLLVDPNDLWKFGAEKPNDPIGIADPCTMVYPDNLWKTPSKLDFDNLKVIQPNSLFVIDRDEPQFDGVLGLLFPVKYLEFIIGWNSSSTSDNAYDILYKNSSGQNATTRGLFLSGVGYRDGLGTAVEHPQYAALLSLGSPSQSALTVAGGLGGAGFYWYRKSDDSGNSADYYKFQHTYAKLASLDLGIAKLDLFNTDDIENFTLPTFSKEFKLNIRCVRNPNYPSSPTY